MALSGANLRLPVEAGKDSGAVGDWR